MMRRNKKKEKGLPIAGATVLSSTLASSIELSLHPDRPTYVGGQTLSGKLIFNVLHRSLWITELELELTGYEELKSVTGTTSSNRILYSRQLLISPSLPRSNAVSHATPPSNDYSLARIGATHFAFAFPSFDLDTATACKLGRNASRHYELTAKAHIRIEGEDPNVVHEVIPIDVVELWDDTTRSDVFTREGKKVGSEVVKSGGAARVGLEAKLKGRKEGGRGRLFWGADDDDAAARDLDATGASVGANSEILVEVKVRNGAKRNIAGMKVSFCRRLKIVSVGANLRAASPLAPIVTDIVHSDHFRGPEYEVAAGEDRDIVLALQLPMEKECLSTRKGKLFDIEIYLRIQVECNFLAKDLIVELPIWIAHPLSLPSSFRATHSHRRRSHSPLPLPYLPPPHQSLYRSDSHLSLYDPTASFVPSPSHSPSHTAAYQQSYTLPLPRNEMYHHLNLVQQQQHQQQHHQQYIDPHPAYFPTSISAPGHLASYATASPEQQQQHQQQHQQPAYYSSLGLTSFDDAGGMYTATTMADSYASINPSAYESHAMVHGGGEGGYVTFGSEYAGPQLMTHGGFDGHSYAQLYDARVEGQDTRQQYSGYSQDQPSQPLTQDYYLPYPSFASEAAPSTLPYAIDPLPPAAAPTPVWSTLPTAMAQRDVGPQDRGEGAIEAVHRPRSPLPSSLVAGVQPQPLSISTAPSTDTQHFTSARMAPPLPPASPSARYHQTSTSTTILSYDDLDDQDMEELLERQDAEYMHADDRRGEGLSTIGEEGESTAGTIRIAATEGTRNDVRDAFHATEDRRQGQKLDLGKERRNEGALERLEARLAAAQIAPLPFPASSSTKFSPPPLPALSHTPHERLATSSPTLAAPVVASSGGALRARSISRTRCLSEAVTRGEVEELRRAKSIENRERATRLRTRAAMESKEIEKKERIVSAAPLPVAATPNTIAPALAYGKSSDDTPSTSEHALATSPSASLKPVPGPASTATTSPVPTRSSRLPSWLTSSSPSASSADPTTKVARRSTFDFSSTTLPTSVSQPSLRAPLATVPLSVSTSVIERLDASARVETEASEKDRAKEERNDLRRFSFEQSRNADQENASRKVARSKAATLQVDDDQEDRVRYDIRSARGGKGGKVFAVASNWAEIVAAAEEPRVSSDRALTPLDNRSITSVAFFSPQPSTAKTTRIDGISKSFSTPNVRQIRISEPALARPFLNQTIGKPVISSYHPTAATPLIADSIPSATSSRHSFESRSASPTKPASAAVPSVERDWTKSTETAVRHGRKKSGGLSAPSTAKAEVNSTVGRGGVVSSAASIARSFSTPQVSSYRFASGAAVGGGNVNMKRAGEGDVRAMEGKSKVRALLSLFDR